MFAVRKHHLISDRIALMANLEKEKELNKFGLDSYLESTFHSFGRIDLSGKIDLQNSPKTAEILAKSRNGEYHVELKTVLEVSRLDESKGQLKLTAIVPLVGLKEKDFEVRQTTLIDVMY